MAGTLTLEQIIGFLIDAPMFGDLDATELSQVVHIMQLQHLRGGQTLFEEGQPGDAWFVVYEGEVDVCKDAGGESDLLARLGPRSCFGEMAILDGSPRSATVRSHGDATVFRFPRMAFRRLLDDGNLAAYKLVLQMALVLVARQRETTARLVELLKQHEDDRLHAGLSPIVERSSTSE